MEACAKLWNVVLSSSVRRPLDWEPPVCNYTCSEPDPIPAGATHVGNVQRCNVESFSRFWYSKLCRICEGHRSPDQCGTEEWILWKIPEIPMDFYGFMRCGLMRLQATDALSQVLELRNGFVQLATVVRPDKKTKHIKYKQNTCLLMKNLRWIFVFFCVFPTFAVQVSFGSREAVATCNIDENCLAIIALSKPQRSHCNFIEQDDFRKSKQP